MVSRTCDSQHIKRNKDSKAQDLPRAAERSDTPRDRRPCRTGALRMSNIKLSELMGIRNEDGFKHRKSWHGVVCVLNKEGKNTTTVFSPLCLSHCMYKIG